MINNVFFDPKWDYISLTNQNYINEIPLTMLDHTLISLKIPPLMELIRLIQKEFSRFSTSLYPCTNLIPIYLNLI